MHYTGKYTRLSSLKKQPMRRILLSLFLVFVVITGNAAPRLNWQSVKSALRQPQKATFIEINAEADELMQFRMNLKKFTALEGVKISGATDATICGNLFSELAALPRVKTLHLEFNEFTTLPESIRKLQHVENLSIWGNEEMDYDDCFKKLVSLVKLQTLELNANEFTEIPASLSYLRQLHALRIGASESADMEELCENVAALPALDELSLEVFDMAELSPSVFKLENIKKLNVGILRESEDAVGNDNQLFSSNYTLTANRKTPLAVNFTASTYALGTEEKALFAELSGYSGLQKNTPQPVDATPEEYIPFKREYNNVRQPIPGVDVIKDIHVVDAGKESKFYYRTGTEVVIPKNAFVDAAGRPVTGEVLVDYREFRDPIDFIVSGIPMTYNDNGVVQNFESAGMFEINASVNGKEVFLANGKNVKVNLALNDSAEKYDFFKFNAESGAWDKNGTAGVTQALSDPQARIQRSNNYQAQQLSVAARAYLQWKSSGKITWHDTLPLQERFENPEYFYTKRIFNRKKDAYVHTKSKKHPGKTIKNTNLVRFRTEKSANKGEYCFRIIHWGSKNPEMGAMHNMVWKLDEPLTGSQFRKKYTTKKKYSDIRIESDGDNGFTLRLKSMDGIVEIPVSPYVAPDKKEELVYKNASSRYRQYKRQLRSRQRSFDRRLRKEREFVSYTYSRSDSASAWGLITMMMKPEEKKMAHADWKELYQLPEKIEDSKSVSANNYADWGMTKRSGVKTAANILWGASIGLIGAAISIGSLGTYNCDRFAAPFDPYQDNSVQLVASYRDPQGSRIENKTTYMLNQGINGMLTYDAPATGRPVMVRYGKIKGNLMLVIDAAGNVSYFTPKDFKSADDKGRNEYTYTMRRSDMKITSADALRRLVREQHLFEE